jgi:CDP-6-deoxy-D-xylo-4-hexulose-3-dehydrase
MVKPGAPFTRQDLQSFLESKGVETRPIQSGDMSIQPAMKSINHRVSGLLTNAAYIHKNAFWWGNHQGVNAVEREAIVGYFKEFFGVNR